MAAVGWLAGERLVVGSVKGRWLGAAAGQRLHRALRTSCSPYVLADGLVRQE